MAGLRVLVTAGPTREPLDPVRYLTNRSSGHSDPQKTDRTATRERKQFQDKARNTI